MKKPQFYLLVIGVILSSFATAQFYKSDNPSWDLTGGAGVANYYGDLTEKSRFFDQSSYAFGVGVALNYNPHISFRADISYSKVQAADSKNKRADLKARNLNFKSSIFDFDLAVEYNILDIENNHRFTPYVFAGIGFAHFNPYTKDRNGVKQILQPLGTEGQGLAAYPNRKMYKKSTVEFPLGIGATYPINDNISLQFEINYRITGTDYLDDVSTNGYPDKTLLDARNPVTAKFTWRGNEVGEGAYPKNLALPRGNPSNKDGYLTTQLKVAYNF